MVSINMDAANKGEHASQMRARVTKSESKFDDTMLLAASNKTDRKSMPY